jgi:hypothetical protein
MPLPDILLSPLVRGHDTDLALSVAASTNAPLRKPATALSARAVGRRFRRFDTSVGTGDATRPMARCAARTNAC